MLYRLLAGDVPGEGTGSKPRTTKSDVYSFGVALLEIICGKPPRDVVHRSSIVHWVGRTHPSVPMHDQIWNARLKALLHRCSFTVSSRSGENFTRNRIVDCVSFYGETICLSAQHSLMKHV